MLSRVGDIGFGVAAIGAAAFVLTYSITTRWWRYPTSRYLMSFASVLAVIILLALARQIYGPYPGLWLIKPIADLSLAAVIWGAEIALIRVQITRRRNKANS